MYPESSGLGDPTEGRRVLRGHSCGRTRVSRAGHRQTLLRSRAGRGSGRSRTLGQNPDCIARPSGRGGAWRPPGVIRASRGGWVGGWGSRAGLAGLRRGAGAPTIGPARLDEPGDPSVRCYLPPSRQAALSLILFDIPLATILCFRIHCRQIQCAASPPARQMPPSLCGKHSHSIPYNEIRQLF